MLEDVALGPRFTISLKRSTLKSAAIHKPPADYPIYWGIADIGRALELESSVAIDAVDGAHSTASMGLR
jgi:hypothetical protein